MQVNGENIPIDKLKEPNIKALLEYFKLLEENIAIEYNKIILPKKDYYTIVLNEKDTLEIIHFVGGG